MEKTGVKIVAKNSKAFHEYFVEERFEAGIELFGTEVKSIRLGTLNLKDAWCSVKDGELWVRQMHISPYEKGNIFNKDPIRPRRLLMHKREIQRLASKVQLDGYAIVPLSVYLKNSRVKVEVALCKGKKLYELARAGKEVERQARHVDLPAIEILEIKFPVVKFRVECSKGTYIRSLCADIGEKLCCGGTMQSLVRTRVGEFRLADALTLAQLQELRDTERLEEALLPTDRIFSDFPMLHVEEKWRKLIDNGNAFYPGQTVEQTTHPAGEWVRIYREDDSFVGIYAYDGVKEWYKPMKIFPSNTESRK